MNKYFWYFFSEELFLVSIKEYSGINCGLFQSLGGMEISLTVFHCPSSKDFSEA